MIKLDNINLKYRKVIFENMNFEISKPGIYGIIGESGIGKSTILNILYGLELNYTGNYYLGDKDMSSSTDIQKYYGSEIALIHQDNKLITRYKAIDNIKLAMIEEKTNDEIYVLAAKLNIDVDTLNKKVKYLSGGEKQRIAILRAIVNQPKVLLFDEPTSGLDRVNRQNFIDLLAPLKDLGIIVIIVSHDFVLRESLDSVYEIYDHNIHLRKGSSLDVEDKKLEYKNNKGLYKFTFKSMINNKALISLFLVLSTIFLVTYLFLITPVSTVVEEYNRFVASTFETVDIVVGSNNTFSEEELQAISDIEGIESVTPYGYYVPIENFDLYNAAKVALTDEEFYMIDDEAIINKYYLAPGATFDYSYKYVNDNYTSVTYIEGQGPQNNNEVAIGASSAKFLEAEFDIESVVGLILPLTCTNVVTNETFSCDKVITGVVDEYNYETPSSHVNNYDNTVFLNLYMYEPTFEELPSDVQKLYENTIGQNTARVNIVLSEDANHDEVVNELEKNEDLYIRYDETTYFEDSNYKRMITDMLRASIVFYILGAIFIFVVTLAYFVSRRKEFNIYLILGYKKQQIFTTALIELGLIYLVSYTLASIIYLLLPLPTHTNFIWLLILGIIFFGLYLLGIIYLALGLRKKHINKELK